MCVAAWAYITAALSMGVTALLFVERSGWEVPRQLLGPLVRPQPSLQMALTGNAASPVSVVGAQLCLQLPGQASKQPPKPLKGLQDCQASIL